MEYLSNLPQVSGLSQDANPSGLAPHLSLTHYSVLPLQCFMKSNRALSARQKEKKRLWRQGDQVLKWSRQEVKRTRNTQQP